MSRSAYASSLRTLGGVYKTKSPASVGSSGSNANQEGEGESAISPGSEPVIENVGAEVIPQDLPDSPPRRVPKRKKNIETKPPRA